MELKVKDIMTKKVIWVSAEDSLRSVVDILFRYGFDGVPVTDKSHKLLGIITQYDLVTKSSGLHLPTLEKVFQNIPVLKKDKGSLKDSFMEIHKLEAKDIMNPEPITVKADERVDNATRIFVQHHRVNPLPVVDDENKVVGILSRYDVIKLYNPDYFGAALKEAHTDAVEHKNSELEKETKALLGAMKKSFVLVSKWRTRFWYLIAGVFFIIGFITAITWVVQITIE